jgi:hypothetical protein
MDVMGKLDGLCDYGPQRVITIGCLATDGPTLLKGLVWLIGAARLIGGGVLLSGFGDGRQRCKSERGDYHRVPPNKYPQDIAGPQQDHSPH